MTATPLSPVRIAGADEEESIMELCRELYHENGLFSLDESLVRTMLQKAFTKQGGIIGLIGEPGKIEAAIYMIISNFWYSRDAHLEELFSFVRPQHRQSTHAKSLIAFAKTCSDGLQVPLVIGIVSNERTEAKVKLYQRQLQKPAGAFFVYGSKWKFGEPVEAVN